jgi:hypothetical protein
MFSSLFGSPKPADTPFEGRGREADRDRLLTGVGTSLTTPLEKETGALRAKIAALERQIKKTAEVSGCVRLNHLGG